MGIGGTTSADTAAILAHINIQSLCGTDFFITTELLNIENIRYFGHTQLSGEPLLKRAFLDGSIFVSGMLDTLLCQRRSKLHTMDFLRHLTFSHLTDAPEANAIKAFNPGQLNLLTMPDHYIGQSYSIMARYMMKYYTVVPLAILRLYPTTDQPFYSVIFNLCPSTIMNEADAIYMLGPPIPGWSELSMGPRKTAGVPRLLYIAASESVMAFVMANESGQSSAFNQPHHSVNLSHAEPSSLAGSSASMMADSDRHVITVNSGKESNTSNDDSDDHVSF
ncbi:hypothetical protein GGF37_003197 [Kickxella alabastrina]|nr:hypothetical protein GGF37_003197 [Kickxella alabastrina]